MEEGWHPDPIDETRRRYFDGKRWTQHVVDGDGNQTEDSLDVIAFTEDFEPSVPKWQYAVVNVGMFNSPERMADVLAQAGSSGWELVTVYDKASNWFAGMEKGFMLFKRPVPRGTTPLSWCVRFGKAGSATKAL